MIRARQGRCRWDLKTRTPGGVTDSSVRLKNIMFVCLLLASSHTNKWFPCTPAIITTTQQGFHSGAQWHAACMVCCVVQEVKLYSPGKQKHAESRLPTAEEKKILCAVHLATL